MSILRIKIRDKYIQHIAEYSKKHEYRLAYDKYLNVKKGDMLIMVSNQDPSNSIKVVVNNIKKYANWDLALEENWQDDFRGLYDNKEQVLKECYKFYPKEEVEKYGILVFDIAPSIQPIKNATVLLDTNIIIQRESSNIVSDEVMQIYKMFDKLGIRKYIHPKTKEEIKKYKDEKIRDIMLKKIDSYMELSITDGTDVFLDRVFNNYAKDDNSLIDNELLKQAYFGVIDYLITNDKEMIRKASDLGISDMVMTPMAFFHKINTTYPDKVDYKMLSVKKRKFSEVNLNSSFFDSLRDDYSGFDNWYKSKRDEEAYVFEIDNELKAFLYLKIEEKNENYSDISPIFLPKLRLKVGTFKIDSKGFRLSERFIKIIFDNALKANVEEVYVTLFENKREEVNRLEEILFKWGFVRWGHKTNGEVVLVKNMNGYDNKLSVKENYPNVSLNNSWILPIYPKYHTDLFPDMILSNENSMLYNDNMAHRYALEKVYVSSADPRYTKAKPGDYIFIYRTGERYPKKYSSVITGICILESVKSFSNLNDFITECGNRSVFSNQELRNLFSKYKTVIKMIQYKTFSKKVILNDLYELGIVEEDKGPRNFTYVSQENFNKLIKKGGLN